MIFAKLEPALNLRQKTFQLCSHELRIVLLNEMTAARGNHNTSCSIHITKFPQPFVIPVPRTREFRSLTRSTKTGRLPVAYIFD
jgi:hypothetical protein